MNDLLAKLNAMRPTDGESEEAPIVDKPEKKEPRGNFDCPECGLGFAHAPTLADHIAAEHAPKHEKKLDSNEISVSGILHSTDKAVLYKLQQDGKPMQFWIPKAKHQFNADTLVVTYPDWFDLNIGAYTPFVPKKRGRF